jgi:WhiB family transcriptional regulator, redox-sensing transcriptional regulator
MEETVAAVHHQDWTALAKCRGTEDAMFGTMEFDQKRAIRLCAGCPVRSDCLAEALDNRIEWGVWGGMTERQRRLLLRQRADVSSWKVVLARAGAANTASPVPGPRHGERCSATR